ncbi:GntP family permease [Halobacillus locisalis]|uniref:GntP family permease n=1 Tax=Halobacillus locisalis TaxID=220753 RepID=A0A838CVP1_9BACI|nr:GntP family permease [Halobacillus locisalis]MBA2175899.1 GntP family permease [Halobacillus locisalis]
MISILIGLGLLMLLAYLGWSIIWIAPLVSGIVAILSGMNILESYTSTYMEGFVGFAKDYFPIFLFGAIFGKLMEDTGAAQSVAYKISSLIGETRAILGMLLSAAILTYGGVSLFVVVFAVYPLAVAMFRQANVPRKLIPSTFVLGAFTFTMTALPGTPQIQNIIPINTFKTSTMAAPILGIVAGLIMAVLGYFYLKFREKQLVKNGEEFTEPQGDSKVKSIDEEELPNWILSVIPLLAVVLTLNLFDLNILIALLIGIVLIMVFNFDEYKSFIDSVNGGASGSVMATINTSAAVGFGSVVTASPGFDSVKEFIFSIPFSPYFSEAFAVSLLAMITGSASGGMGIALEALGQEYYDIAVNQGLSLEAFHRITSVASGASILPHNGALLTLFTVTGLTHKDSYKDVFVVGLVIPMIATIAIIFLAMMGIN